MKEDCKEMEIKMGQRAGDEKVCHNTQTRLHSHKLCFALYRRNGFYTVQNVNYIPLH